MRVACCSLLAVYALRVAYWLLLAACCMMLGAGYLLRVARGFMLVVDWLLFVDW